MSTHHDQAMRDLANARTYAEMGSPIRELGALTLIQQELDAAKFAAVTDARFAGESWQSIGYALGITKQAAQQRYSPRAPKTASIDGQMRLV